MLKKVDSLPSSELKPAVGNGNRLTGAGQGHLQMARGIIGPLSRMDESGMILGHQILEETMQVGPSRWVGILVDHEAGTGVLHEDGGKARRDTARAEEGLHLVGDIIGPLPRRGEYEAFGHGFHELMNEGRGFRQSPIQPSAAGRQWG